MINSKELKEHTKNLSLLFVEDHDELRATTVAILENIFKEVHSATNGKDAIQQYNNYHKNHSKYFDLVLSDIQMPIMNGVELTERIYATNENQALIILSAYDESKYLLPLINLGIEQFIKKPIDFQELLLALLNASKKVNQTNKPLPLNSSSKIILNDIFTYDRENHTLEKENINIYLTKYEIIFLQQLSSKLGKIYSNEDIVINYNSQHESIDSNNIRKLVSKLRKKLPENSIESIYGVGYKLRVE